jgi:amino-acid N-acetyltransferase
MEIIKAIHHRESIAAILDTEKLPSGDLPSTLENFVVALQNGEVIGVAGLEIYTDYGLLRSLAVKPIFRDKGVAGKLLLQIEDLASSKGLKAIYLMTETAPGYFNNKGYIKVTRTEVPLAIQASSEFSHVCPQSAIVMKKILTA